MEIIYRVNQVALVMKRWLRQRLIGSWTVWKSDKMNANSLQHEICGRFKVFVSSLKDFLAVLEEPRFNRGVRLIRRVRNVSPKNREKNHFWSSRSNREINLSTLRKRPKLFATRLVEGENNLWCMNILNHVFLPIDAHRNLIQIAIDHPDRIRIFPIWKPQKMWKLEYTFVSTWI